ncbi:MAG: aminoacyl-tRNA hydrolase [Pseudanabaena sp. ELA607]|jgi:PTH1 family peptidyl-tRNA hydrolase
MLIIGLGNPGSEYERTRHNIGFLALDYLAQRWGITFSKEKRFQALFGEGNLLGQKVRLLKPTTYMNNSGQAVRACADWYKCSSDQVLVVYDDMDLPVGKIRLRSNGSAGGHNGMKSIISHLGTQDFARLRLGIGRSPHQTATGNAVGHVLGTFSSAETATLPELFNLTEAAIISLRQEGLPKAMSLYNNRSIVTQ